MTISTTPLRDGVQHGQHWHTSRFGVDNCEEYVPDPRKVGDLTFSGYWRTYSLILNVVEIDGVTWVTELNLTEPNQSIMTGTPNVKRHCTRWDWTRDEIVGMDYHQDMWGWEIPTYDDYLAILRDHAEHDYSHRYRSGQAS